MDKSARVGLVEWGGGREGTDVTNYAINTLTGSCKDVAPLCII